MLGRQNVSNQHVAVIELVKNAFDADSPSVDIRFTNAAQPEGEIIIRDYGSGMTLKTLKESWLTLGTDYKEREPVSPMGRVRTGAKGIGRFALDRLGGIGILETFNHRSRRGIRVTVDWSKYDNTKTSFESITHDFEYIENTGKIVGTTLIITQLRDNWDTEDFETLHNDLIFLIPPLDNFKNGFDINLLIDTNPELSGTIQPLVREAAEYELISSLSADGHIRHKLVHRTDNETVELEKKWSDLVSQRNPLKVQKELFGDPPECGPVSLHMLFFLRSSNEDRNLDFNLSALRKYLDVFSGIRIYRDGFQVKPYGSKGNDWLGLNGRKARSPEGVGQDLGRYRVSSNQLVGTVSVSRTRNINLEDKANREGIIENDAFQDLKDFLLDAIRYLELQRQEKERRFQRREGYEFKQIISDIDTINVKMDRFLQLELNDESSYTDNRLERKAELIEFKDKLDDFKENLEAKLEENQLLRALATVGIALSTFSHEIQARVSSISNELTLTKPLLDGLRPKQRGQAEERIDIALSAAERIQDWSNYILESVASGHRVEQLLSFATVWERTAHVFGPSFEFRRIRVIEQISPDIPRFLAFPIDLEAILINLISNSVKALETGIPLDRRFIQISARYLASGDRLYIEFQDSGSGIDLHKLPHSKKGIEQIFEAFVTASGESGTGMGLAVVAKIVHGLGGSIVAHGNGDLGGAEFMIEIPLKIPEGEAI